MVKRQKLSFKHINTLFFVTCPSWIKRSDLMTKGHLPRKIMWSDWELHNYCFWRPRLKFFLFVFFNCRVRLNLSSPAGGKKLLSGRLLQPLSTDKLLATLYIYCRTDCCNLCLYSACIHGLPVSPSLPFSVNHTLTAHKQKATTLMTEDMNESDHQSGLQWRGFHHHLLSPQLTWNLDQGDAKKKVPFNMFRMETERQL